MWYPFLGAIILSIPETFWDTKEFLYEIFWFWEKKFDGESWFPLPLSSVIFFDTSICLQHRKVPLQKFSALWDKTISTETHDLTLSSKKFFWYLKLLTDWGVLLPKFSTRRQSIFDGDSWHSLSLSCPENFPISATFSDTEVFPYEIFETVTQQIFDKKSCYSPFRPWIFRYLKLSETQKSSSKNIF